MTDTPSREVPARKPGEVLLEGGPTDAIGGAFWEWLPRAYRQPNNKDAAVYTRWNMEAAFREGSTANSRATTPPPADRAVIERAEMALVDYEYCRGDGAETVVGCSDLVDLIALASRAGETPEGWADEAALARTIEGPIFRRALDHKLDGYTKDTAEECARAVMRSLTSQPVPFDTFQAADGHTVVVLNSDGVIYHNDGDPNAEIRDSETGEVIFPAVKAPFKLVPSPPVPADSSSEATCKSSLQVPSDKRLDATLAELDRIHKPNPSVALADLVAACEPFKELAQSYEISDANDNSMVICSNDFPGVNLHDLPRDTLYVSHFKELATALAAIVGDRG